MFFGLCIYETLSEDGRLDSIIVTPSGEKILVADHLREVGPILEGSVDVGPLRFYTDEHGLSVRTAKSVLRPPLFKSDMGRIEFLVQHSHLPLRQSHAGYHIILLPSGYSGYVRSSDQHPQVMYLQDTKQLLISSTAYPESPRIEVEGQLDTHAPPPSNVQITTAFELFRSHLPGVHYTPVDNLLRALRQDLTASQASAFLCHSSADKSEVRRLAIELAMRGIRPWIDEAEIRIGDSLIEKIEEGISSTTCLVPVLSKNSVNSKWCKEELRMALARQISKGVKGVLPVLLDDCEIPGFLLEKAYADLRKWDTYDQVVDRLAADIKHMAKAV